MPRVVCHAVYCAHNLGGEVCNAAVIEVNKDGRLSGEDTDCATFIPREFSGSLLTLDNINYSGLVAQAFSGRHCTDPEVRCLVESCIHNNYGACSADEIRVLPDTAHSSAETLCASFHDRS